MQRIIISSVSLLVLATLTVACGADPNVSRATGSVSRESNVDIETPELQAVDARLDVIETRTAEASDRIDGLQDRVAEVMGPEARTANVSLELASSQTYVEVDERSLIAVNGIGMSRDEFDLFTKKRGKAICQPQPILAVHPAANYEIVAWALDRIYDQSCLNVDIISLE